MKKTLVFDATAFSVGNPLSRHGIYFAAKSIVKALISSGYYNIELYCRRGYLHALKASMQTPEFDFLKGVKIISEDQDLISRSAIIPLELENGNVPENWGVWTTERAAIHIPLDVAKIKKLKFLLETSNVFKTVSRIKITGKPESKVYYVWERGAGTDFPSSLIIDIPTADFKDGFLDVVIHAEGASSMKNINEGNDYRILGISVLSIKLIINNNYSLDYYSLKQLYKQVSSQLENTATAMLPERILLKQKNSLMFKLLLKHIFGRKELLSYKLKHADYFLSPAEAVPEEIEELQSLKKAVILYDTIPLEFNFVNDHNWFKLLCKSINSDTYYFAISEHTKKDFLKHFPAIDKNKINVIPLGPAHIPSARSEQQEINKVLEDTYGISSSVKYFLSLCSIAPHKNFIFAIKNYLEFVKRNNIEDCIFIITGSMFDTFKDQFSRELSAYSADDVKKYIKFTGYIPDEDVKYFYEGALALVYPSLYEGFGLPVLEAMVFGTPVICSGVTSLPEVIGDCGIKINPKDDESIIKAFEKMYNDEAYRKNCSALGKNRALNFTWEKAASAIKTVFDSVS